MNNRILQVIFRLSFALSIPLATIIHISLNKPRHGVHLMKIFIDDLIPFNAYFAVPYLFMFAFILIMIFYLAIADADTYFRFLTSLVTGMFVCFLVYYLFPTTVHRQIIFENDYFSRLVKYIYNSDNPYNCFPSIHVLSSYLPILFIFKYNKSGFMRRFTLVSGVLISVSTMFVKQHYFLDAVASLILGTVLYLVFTNESIWSRLPFKAICEFSVNPGYKTEI